MMRAPISFLALVLAAACATPQVQTIEPEPDGQVATLTEEGFALSREKRPPGWRPDPNVPIHLGEKWAQFRAGFLGIPEEEVAIRESRISEAGPPEGFWDPQTSVEALSLWLVLCNECHGGRRTQKDLDVMPPPEPGWGRGQSIFFGKERPYSDIYQTILLGGPIREGKPSEMPAWRGKIANEEIWAIIYFLEYQSFRRRGTVPPSLYPRTLKKW